MKVLFLNPFHGGSHRQFAEGWARHSRHAIQLLTLPARAWKWRMRGAALDFAHRVASPAQYDALITTGLMSLADLKAIWSPHDPPALAYFHETQLSYPLPPGEAMDYQFGFTDITSALAARRVLFNSRVHQDAFFAALPGFLKMMPDHRPAWVVEAIRSRSAVLHPGCDVPAGPLDLRPPDPGPALILWNHRWEFDKRPQDFFAALDAVLARGAEFRLALLGESFQAVPKEFLKARERYGARLVRCGFVEAREEYLEWLRRGAIVVSTAEQENFGMAVVEAVRHGCHPLLPRRLAYPEVLPAEFHPACLYDGPEDLADRLERLLRRPEILQETRRALSASMAHFAWERVIDSFDAEIDGLAAGPPAAR